MNRVMLVGRLTTKPELRYTGSNLPYSRFSVAVNRTFTNNQGQREADFINVVVWRKQAENVCNFLDKGSLVSVEGRLQTSTYEVNGEKRYTTKGDANDDIDDGYITNEDIVGISKFRIAYIGYPSVWLHDMFSK